ncbi:MAG: hypothetical protein H6536_03200 [Bacteroidales bacterium]|nr:hypothetical protein [Bacteroidales bacterium]
MFSHKIIGLVTVSITLLLLSGCKCSTNQERDSLLVEEAVDTLATLIKFEDSVFPLPSPWQVATLIKKVNIPYSEGYLNKADKYQKYSTTFKQALNLGIYGTDISYLNVYEKTQESINYLGTIKKLSEQLGVNQAFEPKVFESIEHNINNRDSLTHIISRAYTNSDSYLKTSDRNDIGALIIAGGWIESMYILTQIVQENSHRDIINRIGEQKHPLDNLIELLTPFYYKSAEFSALIDDLIDLAYEFDGVIYSYTYREPKIDPEHNLIIINSQSRVIMSEYHIQIISKKIAALRNKIVE